MNLNYLGDMLAAGAGAGLAAVADVKIQSNPLGVAPGILLGVGAAIVGVSGVLGSSASGKVMAVAEGALAGQIYRAVGNQLVKSNAPPLAAQGLAMGSGVHGAPALRGPVTRAELEQSLAVMRRRPQHANAA